MEIANKRKNINPFPVVFSNSEQGNGSHREKIGEFISPVYDGAAGYKKIFIKNMVSARCKMLVKLELENLGLHCKSVELGEVEIFGNINSWQYERLKTALLVWDLELIENKKCNHVERIKNAIIEMIHYSEDLPHVKISEYLSDKLNYDYTYLANIFSEIEGTPIRNFIINHKIERVKALLKNEDLTLSQIAFKLNYSSVSHLSNQFKNITGLSPSSFKGMKEKQLVALEYV